MSDGYHALKAGGYDRAWGPGQLLDSGYGPERLPSSGHGSAAAAAQVECQMVLIAWELPPPGLCSAACTIAQEDVRRCCYGRSPATILQDELQMLLMPRAEMSGTL